jgi:Circadian oscillating protein COP23
MKCNFSAYASIATLALSVSVPLSARAEPLVDGSTVAGDPSYSAEVAALREDNWQPTASNTSFKCSMRDDVPATVIVSEGKELDTPLIRWKPRIFGEQFSSQKRCEIVSAKFNRAVSVAGSFDELELTHGKVNGLPVICATRPGQNCSVKNLFFILKPENTNRSLGLLMAIGDFSRLDEDIPIVEPGRISFNLGQAVRQMRRFERDSIRPL